MLQHLGHRKCFLALEFLISNLPVARSTSIKGEITVSLDWVLRQFISAIMKNRLIWINACPFVESKLDSSKISGTGPTLTYGFLDEFYAHNKTQSGFYIKSLPKLNTISILKISIGICFTVRCKKLDNIKAGRNMMINVHCLQIPWGHQIWIKQMWKRLFRYLSWQHVMQQSDPWLHE